MEKRLKEKMDAIYAFERFCEKNKTVWINLEGFSKAINLLKLKIVVISNTESEQEQNNKGVTKTKSHLKIKMAQEAVIVAEALQAYALAISDLKLYECMKVTYTTIKQAKTPEAISKSHLVYDTAKKLPQGAIEKFGVSQEQLQLLLLAINKYNEIAPSTRLVKTNKTTLTKNLWTLVGEANALMRKHLLKTGRQFMKTHPDFYKGMIENAKVQHNHIYTKIRLTVFDAQTQEPLAGILAVVEGTELKGITDMHGKCTLTRVPEGINMIALMKTDYVPMKLAADFKRGKAINRKMEMSKTVFLPIIYNRSDEVEEMKME